MEIIILEDEIDQANRLEKELLKIDNSFNIIKYGNVENFKNDFKSFKEYSIFLMDIILQDSDGIELAKLINKEIKGAAIIFISGCINKASQVYDVNHCYFIYKPELLKRLPIAINKAINLTKKNKNSIVIKNNGSTIVIMLSEVIYFERNLRTTKIHLKDKMYQTYNNFNEILDQIPDNFYQCHRSFIVNFDEVREHQRTCFIMKNGTSIDISRSHEKDAKEAFFNYLVEQL